MQGIYVITEQISGWSYVGQSIDLDKRINEHFAGHNTNKNLWADIQLLGKEMFSVKKYEFPNASRKELNMLEESYIQKHNSHQNGYNATEKARGGGKTKNHQKGEIRFYQLTHKQRLELVLRRFAREKLLILPKHLKFQNKL